MARHRRGRRLRHWSVDILIAKKDTVHPPEYLVSWSNGEFTWEPRGHLVGTCQYFLDKMDLHWRLFRQWLVDQVESAFTDIANLLETDSDGAVDYPFYWALIPLSLSRAQGTFTLADHYFLFTMTCHLKVRSSSAPSNSPPPPTLSQHIFTADEFQTILQFLQVPDHRTQLAIDLADSSVAANTTIEETEETDEDEEQQ